MRFSVLAAATAALVSSVAAHPGHDPRAEAAARVAHVKANGKRDLGHCAEKMKARGIEARAIQRRSAIVKDARAKRGISTKAPHLKVRDFSTVLNTTHLSATDYNFYDPESAVFSGNASCLLQSETTQGPYFVSGEYIRRNIMEDQAGVPLILDIQVLDMATCEPVVNSMLDFWHCNSTGVYSGVVASGNGDSSDLANLNATFNRGLQPTEYDGVAQFVTTFPGHYTGRATHIHIIASFNGTILGNSTYSGGSSSHVGQLFFDQDLISKVEATAPYSTNTQNLTLNSEDSILEAEAATSDPVVQYSLLGDTIEEGVFAWISVGVDLTVSETVSPAAYLTSNGGVTNSNAGGGGGGPSGNSTGAPPTK